jgi:hypothetical protein
MELELKSVEFSVFDKRRKISLPHTLNSNLAEDIGIQIGDGCLCRGRKDYTIVCSFNAIEDKYYVDNFVIPLKTKLFKNVNLIKNARFGEMRIKIGSKAIFDFYTKIIGLSFGKKDHVTIPKIIFRNKNNTIACLRGIIDTDFSISFKKDTKTFIIILSYQRTSKAKNLLYSLVKFSKSWD